VFAPAALEGQDAPWSGQRKVSAASSPTDALLRRRNRDFLNRRRSKRNSGSIQAALANSLAKEDVMEPTRVELAVEQMESYDGADDYSCDDVRTAWLCAELNRGPAQVKNSFEALWYDR
jgi:hypothetical protein